MGNQKFREPFKEAQRAKRWNDELECYMDPRGNLVVDPSKVDFEAVTKLLPSQATFNTRRLSDKEYLPDLVSKIKEVCEASLTKVVEMKKRKEEELKKMVEEVKITAKLAAEEEQKIEEEQKEEEEEKKEEDQTEEPVLKETEVFMKFDCQETELMSSLAQEEKAVEPWFG
ncbi:hypothetical protein HanPI659440_Chr02g0048821 [Helianthus annuus]|nr:hypothetical protein HanPI659440_Chr02g0048821 [Helianthus annuus]